MVNNQAIPLNNLFIIAIHVHVTTVQWASFEGGIFDKFHPCLALHTIIFTHPIEFDNGDICHHGCT